MTVMLSPAVTGQLVEAAKLNGLVSVINEIVLLSPFVGLSCMLGTTVIEVSLHFRMYIWQL